MFDFSEVSPPGPTPSIAANDTATAVGQYDTTPPTVFFDAGLPDNNSNQGFLEDGESNRYDTLYLVNEVTGDYIALEYGPNNPGNLALPAGFLGTPLVGSETSTSDSPNGTSILRDADGTLTEGTPNPDTPGTVCFVGGTLILTAQGPRAIEELRPSDKIVTRDNGLQPLRWLGRSPQDRTTLANAPHLRPIRISKDALGQGIPARDLDVSPQRRIFVQSRIAQRMFGPDGVLVPAVKLLPLPGVKRLGADPVDYYHLLFDRHELVFANGCISESLLLGPMARATLGPDAIDEIETLFPNLPATTPARTVPKGHRIRRLIDRHSRNPHRNLFETA